VYKSTRGRIAVRMWCSDTLARADFPLESTTVDTSAGQVVLMSAGRGRPQVVLVPGTGFNAAAALPWLRALSGRWAATVVDLPGQPGLSDPRRPWRGRLAWYGRVLDEVLAAADLDHVVLAGNSLGSGGRPGRRLSPDRGAGTGLSRRLHPPIGGPGAGAGLGPVAAACHGRAHPQPAPAVRRPRRGAARGRGGLGDPHGRQLPHHLGPPPLPTALLARRASRPCVVGTGEYDRFLPPRRLAPAVRRAMGLDLRVLRGMGHLTTPAHLDDVISVIAEVADPPSG
jgi:hypothetical protein